MSTQRLPIIVPDDDTTHEAIGAAILRATGYRMLDPEVIVRTLRLLSVAHRDGIEDATVAAILDRARRAEENREFEQANYARKLGELREQHARELASTQQAVSDLVRIGRRVVDARNRGRKTVRVADLLDGRADAQSGALAFELPEPPTGHMVGGLITEGHQGQRFQADASADA